MKKLRVVVAEHNDILRSSITKYLRRMAEVYFVCEAKNGEEALKCVAQLDPDLLTLDINMPKVNGLQVLNRLQQQKARVQVIVFAADSDYYFRTGAPYPGVVAYLQKDNPAALAHAVRELARQIGSV